MQRSIVHLALLVAVILLTWASAAIAVDPAVVRVGVLKFGTVSWELDVVKHHGIDAKQGIEVEITGLASPQATKVALQADAVDVIVMDWIWVSRQRSEGADFTFTPYSTALGALIAAKTSGIDDLPGLRGKRLGIAGGPLDKSWLLLQALAAAKHGMDLKAEVEPVFGAPPLLSELVANGELDAVLTFWHYAARLEARGHVRIIGVTEVARQLGTSGDVPMLGYTFRESWAKANPATVRGFLIAVREAKAILRTSDKDWQRIAPLMKAPDDKTGAALRAGYVGGIPTTWGERQWTDAARLFEILAAAGGAKLVGDTSTLQPGTFWPDAGS